MRWTTLAVIAAVACGGAKNTAAPEDSGVITPDADKTAPTAEEEATFQRMRAELEATIAKKGIPGASIAVVLRGKLAFSAGVGVKRKGGDAPVGPDTLFRVASMSKPIVAAGIMQLAEAGTLDVTHSLRDYVPAFRRAAGFDPRAVHLDHLLAHTAGLPDTDPKRCSTDPSYLTTWATARAGDPYWSPPGALFNYSNENYAFAALALQQLTGTPFHVYLKEHVLIPAGMATATFDPAEASDDRTDGLLVAGMAVPQPIDFASYDCAVSRSFMGVVASAKDYAHLAEKLIARGSDIVTPESLAAMEAPHAPLGTSDKESMGLGLFNVEWRGRMTHHHGGRAYGWESWFAYQPKDGFAVVVLVNADAWSPDEFGYQVIDAFHRESGFSLPDWTTSADGWKPYVGSYNDPYGSLGHMDVTWTAGRMYAHFPDLGKVYELYQYAGDSFAMYIGDSPFSGTFFADKAGTYRYFATRRGVAVRTAGTAAAAFAPPDAPPESAPLPKRASRPFSAW